MKRLKLLETHFGGVSNSW